MKAALALFALVLSIVAAAPAQAAEDVGVVTAVTGSATLARTAGVQPLHFRAGVRWQDVIETGPASSARLLVLGKTSLAVRELSRLELRQELVATARTHVIDLAAGKVRAAVERSLMSPGEQVSVHSANAIVAVRGTDFVVEVLPPPARAQAFGLLASETGGPVLAQTTAPAATTIVYTISGLVSVANPLGTSGIEERIGPFEAVRVEGARDPQRFRFTRADLTRILDGLAVPPPPPTRSPRVSEATAERAEQAALDLARAEIAQSPAVVTSPFAANFRGAGGALPVGLGSLPTGGLAGAPAAGTTVVGGSLSAVGSLTGSGSLLGGTCLTCTVNGTVTGVRNTLTGTVSGVTGLLRR